MINTKFNRKALAEVYEVLMLLEKNQLSKIPKKLVKTIKENKDNDYEVDLQEIENGNLLSETNIILGTIYTYYLATNEEKSIINKLINLKKEKYKNLEKDIWKSKINGINYAKK